MEKDTRQKSRVCVVKGDTLVAARVLKNRQWKGGGPAFVRRQERLLAPGHPGSTPALIQSEPLRGSILGGASEATFSCHQPLQASCGRFVAEQTTAPFPLLAL